MAKKDVLSGYSPNPYANLSCDTQNSCRQDCIKIRTIRTGKAPRELFGLGKLKECPEGIICDFSQPTTIRLVKTPFAEPTPRTPRA